MSVILFKESISKANLAITITSFVHRWVLCTRINTLRILAIRLNRLANNLNVHSENSKTKYLRYLVLLSSLLYIPIVICSAVTLHQIVPILTYNYVISNPITNTALIIAFAGTFVLYLMLPYNIFGLYYIVVCCTLQRMINSLKYSLAQNDLHNYNDIFTNYLAIRRFVADMDKKLSFLMLTSSLHNACVMYFGLTCWLHPKEYGGPFQRASIWFLVPANYLPFFAVILSACCVHEASSSMWNAGQELLKFGGAPTFPQIRLLYLTEKELTLSVWKIVPIKRSFLVATMGTIFTYCVLLDNLRWMSRDI
ncbi:hypothetical protein JTE90_004627 [Oedothorax gibbosus]|uniref:Gustatory receptor n=1 Tax=Oedothorax gibbosus TaxID=931172 RepID=A0AAV6URD8_9ARAC|nr:hypothetical protein JTE90_004627 [Oedothorax gibbosus]